MLYIMVKMLDGHVECPEDLSKGDVQNTLITGDIGSLIVKKD